MTEQYITRGAIRVYRMESQALPHLRAAVYLVLTDDFSPTLIDAGSGELTSSEEILAGLESVSSDYGERFEPTDIQTILLTHAHIDHFGGANRLARELNTRVMCHRFEARMVESYSERAAVANVRYEQFLRESGVDSERVGGVLRGFNFLPGRVRSTPLARRFSDGERFGPFCVHHFPGHSAGHAAYEVGDFLISGDLILAKTLTQIWPERIMPMTGLVRYLESVEKLRRLAERRRESGRELTILAGHESPITDVFKRIELVVKSTHRRNARLLEILERGAEPMTVFELSKRLYLTTHESRTFFAVCDTAARLEYLQLCGRVAAANYDELYNGRTAAVRYVALPDSE